MSRARISAVTTARVSYTVLVPVDLAGEVDAIANTLDVSRNKLLLAAVRAGLPIVVAQAEDGRGAV